MAIASIGSDYTGRLKDISILQYPDPTFSPDDVTSTSFAQSIYARQTVTPRFGKMTRYCSGVQKLVQRYTILLLTGLGSQSFFPEFGTDFMPSVQAGLSPTSRLLATQYFMLANYSVIVTLKAYQIDNPDIPDDERLASAELTDISLQGDYASFKVAITTEAGDDINFLVPLPK